MKRYALVFSFLCLMISLYGQKKEQPELALSKVNPLLKLSAPNQIVRYAHKKFEVKNKSTGILNFETAITLLNEESKVNEQLVVSYDSESKVEDMEVYLYDVNGQLLRKIDKSEYRDVARVDGFSVYQDNRLLYVDVAHHDYPYTIVWKYQKAVKGIEYATFPDWHPQNYEEAVEHSTFTVVIPEEQFLQFRALNLDSEPNIKSDGRNKTYHWEVQQLYSVTPEAYGPGSYEVLPKVLTSPSNFVFDKYEGSLASWKAYGRFMAQLFEGRTELPPTIQSEVQSLVAGLPNRRAKIDRLYRYLQEKMRYVSVQLGIGGWQPFSAEYVAENNYGDCKALTNYMMALLKAADITAYPALIKNGDLYYRVQEDFAFPAFNHMILYVPDEDLWLECTSNQYPTGYIGSGNYNRPALLITESGGKLVNTPSQNKTSNQELIQAKIQIDSAGSANINYKSQLLGQQHERYRYLHHNYAKEEQREQILEQVNIPNFKLGNCEVSTTLDSALSEFNYDGYSSKYVSFSGKRAFIPINKISVYDGVPDKIENRKLPVITNRDIQEKMEMEILLPKGWTPESMPKAQKTIKSPFGTYTMSCEQIDQTIKIQRSIRFNRYKGNPEDYAAFRKFYRDISRVENSMIVVKL